MRDDLPTPSSPWFWDFTLGLALVGSLLPALGLSWALPQIDRARVSEAFSAFRSEQIEAQERFALAMPWPTHRYDDTELVSQLQAELREGAIDVRFGPDFVAPRTVLTLRAGVPLASATTDATKVASIGPTATLLWQCGNGDFPIGVGALAANQTTLPDYLLPISCWRRHALTR